MVDDAGTVDAGDFEGGFGLDDDIGIDLPASAEVAGGPAGVALLQRAHAALAGRAGGIFGADGARLCAAEPIESVHVDHGLHAS